MDYSLLVGPQFMNWHERGQFQSGALFRFRSKSNHAALARHKNSANFQRASECEAQSQLQLAHGARRSNWPKVELPTVAPFPDGELRLTMLKTL